MRPLLLLTCLPLAGCLSGLGAGDATPIRYFSAEPPVSEEEARPASDGPAFRLRRVTSDRYLRERMAWRASDVEYGFYETRRWAELPVVWVERALVRELAREHGVVHTEDASAPALDVHLTGFEEVLSPHEARVALDVRLGWTGGDVLLERRVEGRVPIDRDDPVAVARAMTRALDQTVAEAGGLIVSAME